MEVQIVHSYVVAYVRRVDERQRVPSGHLLNATCPEFALCSFRIAKNFLKFVEAHEAVLSSGSAEQREQSNIAQEMARQKRKRYEVPERILTSRVDPSTTATQYLVKWTDLGYDECTWENVDDLVDFQNLIDSYLERSRSQSHKVSRNASSKSRFEKLETQPEWMSSAGTVDLLLELVMDVYVTLCIRDSS